MSLTKRGTAYESFSYLEKGQDYKAFELAEEIGRVDSEVVQLTADEAERARQVIEDNVLISLHEHLGVFPADITQSPEYTHEGRMATAFRGLANSQWDAVFDNLMDGIINIESPHGWKWTEVLHDLGMRLCDLAHQDFLVHCTSVDGILRAHEENRIAWIVSIEPTEIKTIARSTDSRRLCVTQLI